MTLNVTYPSGLVVSWERDERTGNLRIRDFDTESMRFLPNPNKHELGEALGLRSFDTAVPQGWLDEVFDLTGEYSLGFVWCYDPIVVGDQEYPNIFGFPFPVTPEAESIYALLPESMR